jgi:hypothetical protein
VPAHIVQFFQLTGLDRISAQISRGFYGGQIGSRNEKKYVKLKTLIYSFIHTGNRRVYKTNDAD